VQSDVSIDRVGEVAAERRVRLLIGNYVGLCREREPLEVVPPADVVQPQPLEGVAAQDRGQVRPKPG